MEKLFKVKLLLGSPTNGEKRKELKGTGKTLVEALGQLKAPATITTVGTIEVEYGEQRLSRFLNIPRLKALFNPHKDFYKEAIAKSLMFLLK